jgi:hypothetical protein
MQTDNGTQQLSILLLDDWYYTRKDGIRQGGGGVRIDGTAEYLTATRNAQFFFHITIVHSLQVSYCQFTSIKHLRYTGTNFLYCSLLDYSCSVFG